MIRTAWRWAVGLGLASAVGAAVTCAVVVADRGIGGGGAELVLRGGPVRRVELPPRWAVRYVDIHWRHRTFALGAQNAGRRVTIACNTSYSVIGRQSADISARPRGYERVQVPGGEWLVKWDTRRGGCLAFARNRPVMMICSVGTDRAAALQLLRGVIFRSRWSGRPASAVPATRGDRDAGGTGG